MENEILYRECPLCNQAEVAFNQQTGQYHCDQCGLVVKDCSVLGLFKKGQYGVVSLGRENYTLAQSITGGVSLSPESLKILIGNIYTDAELAKLAAGNLDVIRPVRTVLAQIILEQLREECYFQVLGLRQGVGQPLVSGSHYLPEKATPRQNLEWQSRGNLFGTVKHLVLPGQKFTFVRLDRKLTAVQAFTDGVAVQRKGEEFATYFVGCQPHEAALIAAFVMGKLPQLRPAPPTPQKAE